MHPAGKEYPHLPSTWSAEDKAIRQAYLDEDKEKIESHGLEYLEAYTMLRYHLSDLKSTIKDRGKEVLSLTAQAYNDLLDSKGLTSVQALLHMQRNVSID